MENTDLKTIYLKYVKKNKQGEMEGRTFVKILKDSKIINKKYSTTSADIQFAKTKTKGKKTINYA